jgi:hypothetical protein
MLLVEHKLRPLVEELQDHVFARWVEDKENETLREIAYKLTIAAASLQVSPRAVGFWIIERAEQYFWKSPLLTPDEEDALIHVLDDRAVCTLKETLRVDHDVRARLRRL